VLDIGYSYGRLYTDWSVYQCVNHTCEPCKLDEIIEMPFGGGTLIWTQETMYP